MAAQAYRSGEWITECDPRPGGADCAITVPFWQPDMGRADAPTAGSFALVVAPESGAIGVVGKPYPIRAVLHIDRDPPLECRQTRYCIFPAGPAAATMRKLAKASLILVEVFTAGRRDFCFSLTAKGYRAGIAQIRAWGYPIGAD